MTETRYRKLMSRISRLTKQARKLVKEARDNRLGVPVRVTTYKVRPYYVRAHERTRVTLWPRTGTT